MAIISASRRTDIPAFFSDWFMGRIREGHFSRVNPFNARQVKRVSLAPEEVDAIVFWSKNPRPLMTHLVELDGRGYRSYFQFTLNPYDQVFEPHLPPLAERLTVFCDLAARVGAKRVVWRYDPVILSSATPVEWHLERAALLAAKLAGKTGRLVYSLLDFYGKVSGRLTELERRHGLRLFDIAAADHREELLRLAAGLGRIGARNGMEVVTCAEPVALEEAGIGHGSCIDAGLIRDLGGGGPFAPDRNQRPACRCAASVDMGMYDTCGFRCAYCYATRGEGAILANLARHDPCGAALISRS